MAERVPASSRGGVLIAALALSLSPLPAGATDPPPATPPPTSIGEEITVTATRGESRLGDTSASVVELNALDLAQSAPPSIDDILRQVPGFSLFRRTSSRYANPTTQGISLRGLTSSGASRTLVLEDGVRLNDPFGSWVYWGRVPLAAVERLEVVRGGESALYGSGAMAGVIQVITRRGPVTHAVADASYGSLHTGNASAIAFTREGDWGASAAAESFGTGGYVALAPNLRGPIDTPVNSDYLSGQATIERSTADQGRQFVRAGYYGESRDNGTPDQINSTEIRNWVAGGDWQPWQGSLDARVDGASQGFLQNFSSVAANRESETLTRAESVPVRSLGMSTQASVGFGQAQAVTTGVDLSQVNAATDEAAFQGGSRSSLTATDARQRLGGLFAEDLVNLGPRLSAEIGVRGDVWRNNAEQVGGSTSLPERGRSALSPRIGVVVRATASLRLSLSAYRAFRAPTLNELYRGFRVGNTVTLANADLDAERLSGAEAGALWSGWGSRLNLRAVAYWMEIDRPIANVTVSTTAALITRERENLGRNRSRGLEAELSARLTHSLTLSAGVEWLNATVLSFPAESSLVGKQVPDVPRQSASLTAVYDLQRIAVVSLQARYSGAQFDDDLNQLRLRSWTTLDVNLNRPIAHGLSVFGAGENLFGDRAQVARTPLLTLGPPRVLRAGLRWELPGTS
jgi:outer membrane receptor protein involved in Fe transport